MLVWQICLGYNNIFLLIWVDWQINVVLESLKNYLTTITKAFYLEQMLKYVLPLCNYTLLK